jgi:drug/metabolite transporter (DMT)-like permease
MPVMTVAMAYFIEGQVPTSSVVASLVVLSSGVAICVWQGQASGTLFSILLCTLSTLVRPRTLPGTLGGPGLHPGASSPSSCAR